MNTLDLYEFSGSTTPVSSSTPSEGHESQASASGSNVETPSSPRPSLEEEVTQVFGQLGRFWGGVRKQGATALQAARKDFGQVVVQAREEITKLNLVPEAPRASTDSSETALPSHGASDPSGSTTVSNDDIVDIPTDNGKGKDPAEEHPSDTQRSTTPTQPSINAFFSRLQHALPPQLDPSVLSETIQKHIQPTISSATTQITSATSQVDINQIKASLSSNIQRVQGTTLVQAEKFAGEYLHKSEALLKEAGEFLKDAVKVVPPDGQSDLNAPSGVMWDGSDVWMFPSPVGTPGWGGGDEAKARASTDVQTASARIKRTDALLLRLKHDPSLIRLDPSEDTSIQNKYTSFIEAEITSKGGMHCEEWSTKIAAVLDEKAPDSAALKATHDKLVPSELTSDAFWTRYFFRVHQVREEEEKLKALVEGTHQKEDDFQWDDEEDAATSPTSSKPNIGSSTSQEPATPLTPMPPSTDKHTTPTNSSIKTQASGHALAPSDSHSTAGVRSATASSNVSPRESEDSYDVLEVGTTSSAKSQDESRDSDEGEEDEDSEESDWE